MTKAHLIEVFSGIQGEGLLIGERMIFLRFTSCNLSCNYCDTPMGRPLDTVVLFEQTPGGRDFIETKNPVGIQDAVNAIKALHENKKLHRWVSLTGGEPLIYPRFLLELMVEIKQMGLKVLIETNGTLPIPGKDPIVLSDLLNMADMVSLDIKEKCDGASLQEARKVLFALSINQRWRGKKNAVYIKLVVRPNPDVKHFEKAVKEIYDSLGKATPIILMPVTPYGDIKSPPSPEEVLHLQSHLLEKHPFIRVIPQTHKLINQK